MDDETFVKQTEISIIAPQTTELEIRELFGSSGSRSSIHSVQSVAQRSLLYFGWSRLDELLPIYLALSVEHQGPHDDLKPLFDRLSISLEVRASGSASRDSSKENESKESSPARQEEVIWYGRLIAAEEPTMISLNAGDKGTSYQKIAVWEIKVLLSRPRVRLQSPIITFRARAVLQPSVNQVDEILEDPYLPSGEPLPVNLLEALMGNVGVEAKVPSVSASRLYQVQSPVHEMNKQTRPMRVNVPAAFRALPAISSRVRYHKSSLAGNKTSLVASLDLEMAPFSSDDIEITDVELQLSGGTAIDLGKGLAPRLPSNYKPRDNLVFLYRLILDDLHEDPARGMARSLDIAVKATVLVSDQCRPSIEMHWKTAVDFLNAVNPAYGGPGQSLQRSHRPSSLPISGTSAISHETSGISLNRPSSGQGRRDVGNFGVTITFTAPPKIFVGQPFNWEVLVLNSSSKPQRLVITAVPKRITKEFRERQAYLSSATARPNPFEIANAMVDENTLYDMQKAAMVQTTAIASLSTSVDIGPLNPGSCHSTQLQFVALSKGHFQIDAVKVVNVETGYSVDVTELPDIVVEERTDT